MAQLARFDYYFKLDGKLNTLVPIEKVSFIKQQDTYALKKAEFQQDMSLLPSLGYVHYYWLTVEMQLSLLDIFAM